MEHPRRHVGGVDHVAKVLSPELLLLEVVVVQEGARAGRLRGRGLQGLLALGRAKPP